MTPDSQMMAALYYRPGEARYEAMPTPQPGPGELLVRIGKALTCGTDLKSLRRGHPVLLPNPPCPFGHEFAGTVAAVGEGVTAFEVGDRVVAANSAPCYQCYCCQKGQHNLCEQLSFLNGAYAEYICIPKQIVSYNTHRIPDHLPFEVAAFTEPLAVSLRGVELSDVSPGDHVAILGLGAIGQLLVRVAKWKGAHVTALARSPYKLEVARRFGLADQTVQIAEGWDPKTVCADFTPQGRGFDVVIEAVGLPQTWEQSVAMVRRGGRVNLFAGCESGTTLTLDTRRLHYDELTLLSLFHHTPYYVKRALDLLSDFTIDPTPLISEEMPMAQFETALHKVSTGQAIKIALNPVAGGV
jgi:L-iditol 2-dehydrogenase